MANEETKEAAATVEQLRPRPEPVAEEEAKPVKEKKTKAPREKKPKTASHPPYFQMIKEALMALNEKSGSSPYAIAKYMEEKHKAVLPANFKKIMGLQLKNSAARGKLIKIKASYKLSEETKQTAKKAKAGASNEAEEKKKQKKKPRTVSNRKTRSVNKKTEGGANKKVGAKKAKRSTAANKPKQPKSIKSPAAKRTRKATSVVASAS